MRTNEKVLMSTEDKAKNLAESAEGRARDVAGLRANSCNPCPSSSRESGTHWQLWAIPYCRPRSGGASLTQWRRLDTTLMTRATMTAPNKYESSA